MGLTITASQRDALYEEILNRLGGIEAVWYATKDEDHETATRLGWEFSDLLRFVVEDLGFGPGTGETIGLSTPVDVLRRVLKRLDYLGKESRQTEEAKRAEAEEGEAESKFLERTCQDLLKALDSA